MSNQKNVYGTTLQSCSFSPKTGYLRDGFCTCVESDHGQHTVCAVMTNDFLVFSKMAGNDLSTPKPEYNFPGLKPGDQWCLCLSRWVQAYENDSAPHIILEATNEKVLEKVSLEILKEFEL
tara:strand:+ start:1411 stop:1773 length:363 start_codon:yes stop_codon:yes gene_type:complete